MKFSVLLVFHVKAPGWRRVATIAFWSLLSCVALEPPHPHTPKRILILIRCRKWHLHFSSSLMFKLDPEIKFSHLQVWGSKLLSNITDHLYLYGRTWGSYMKICDLNFEVKVWILERFLFFYRFFLSFWRHLGFIKTGNWTFITWYTRTNQNPANDKVRHGGFLVLTHTNNTQAHLQEPRTNKTPPSFFHLLLSQFIWGDRRISLQALRGCRCSSMKSPRVPHGWNSALWKHDVKTGALD